jgi:hypothetical protein
MPINQLSTSNTFQQWLSATQVLIEKSNYFEGVSNSVFTTANTVYQTANNVSNTANAFYIYNTIAYAQSNASFNVANQVSVIANNASNTANLAFVYSNNSYTAANLSFIYSASASNTANAAYAVVNVAFNFANAAFNHANNAFVYANSAFTTSNLAYTYSNVAVANVNGAAANALAVVQSANATINAATIQIQTSYNAANLFLGYVANNSNLALLTNDVGTDNNLRYILFTDTVPLSNNGVLTQTFVSNTKLYYNPSTGQLNASNFNSLSDERVKKDVIYIEDAVSTLKNIDGVKFAWIENNTYSYGVIAQQLEKILPELVNGTDQKTVNYSGLIAFLINAVKELDTRVLELEKIINNKNAEL